MVSRWRLLDLETAADPNAGKWLDPCDPDPKLLEPILPDSRLKDPVKVAANLEDVARRLAARPLEIEASILERTAERESKLGLDVDCNRIVALGFHDVGYGYPTVLLCSNEFEEREALKTFWEGYKAHPTRLVTYNGIRFDLPTLIMRSLSLDVKHPPLTIAPAWKTDHVDLWNKLSLDGARKDVKSQRFYLRKFGIETNDPITGADVARLVAENTKESWQLIHDHCLLDIGGMHALANRLGVLKVS